MKMLSIDRISNLRPLSYDVGFGQGPVPLPAGVAKVKVVAAVEPAPSLINQMGKKPTAGLVYANPTQRPYAPEPPPHDWRLQPPESEKINHRPAILIEHLKSLWAASALAVQAPTALLASEPAPLAQPSGHPLT